ncbi:MAG: DNA photolyase family protein [Betaproteobacteria bacterium]|nr:DNA photolyase family protein [Betaproteobacteria bacterium]
MNPAADAGASRPPHPDRALVWFRRDLRAHDHAALAAALAAHRQVWCAFVFDTDILAPLPQRADRRVAFIHDSLLALDARLREQGGGLIVRHGRAVEVIARLADELGVTAVYLNRDYEPAAVTRDQAVETRLAAAGRRLVSLKDQVVFERDEVLTGSGTPFSVFTPYRRAWERRLAAEPDAIAERAVRAGQRLAPPPPGERLPSLADIGFEPVDLASLNIRPGSEGGAALLADFARRIGGYGRDRDFPAVRGPSYLSVHLRFGTVSVRELARLARANARDATNADGASVWLGELIWRDFYFQILHHHPRVVDAAFRPEYDRIVWERGATADRLLRAWQEGRTGYPLVDAAMRQLSHSGYMHNRLRMVTASFLVKDLGIDWREGERWFARELIDFDLAANNGGWQWAASTGCDAQPWFRIFNPVTQSQRFDPQGRFIRRYLPALAALPDRAIHAPWLAAPLELAAAGIRLGEDYPRPVVAHERAREATLARYAVVKAPAELSSSSPDAASAA